MRLALITVSISLFLFFAFPSYAASELLIEPNFQKIPMGEELNIDLLIRTDQALVGADFSLNFDDKVLNILSVQAGPAFELVPLKKVEGNKLKITAVNKSGEFIGLERVASLKVKAKDAGDTKLTVEFTPSSTTDSNLTTKKASDVLSAVDEGHFVIGSSFQQVAAGARKVFTALLPLIIFLLFAAAAGSLTFRWWKTQQATKGIFVPEKVPMDTPPQGPE